MYKITCYYQDLLFGECSYICKTNLTLQEAQTFMKEHEHYDDVYIMEEM